MTLRFVPLGLTLCLGIASAEAQDRVRLDEQVRAPLAYMNLVGGAEGRGAMASLQSDPAARMLWSSVVDDSTSKALGQFDALGELGSGEVEVALNALLPQADAPALPLMVCRVELGAARAAELKKSLDAGSLARSADAIAGRETWEFGRGVDGPARRLLVAIVGEDLLASNSEAILGDVLRRVPAGGTSTPHPDSVSGNRTFAAQRAMLGRTSARGVASSTNAPRGHVLHLDWKRLRERWLARMTPTQEVALAALGALTAEHVTIAVKPDDARDATRLTILIDQPLGPQGLLPAASPTTPRKVLGALPPVSLAGLTISLDATRLGGLYERRFDSAGNPASGSANASAEFARAIDDRCAAFGLDFAEQVLPRLSGFGSAQLVLLDDQGSEQGVAFAVGTRSAASARALLTELRASIAELGAPSRRGSTPPPERGGRPHPPRPHVRVVHDERDMMTVEGPFGLVSFGALGDDFVIAPHRGTIERMGRLVKTRAREHARVRARTIELCEAIVAARPASARDAIGVVEIDGSMLGLASDTASGRHAGLLFLDAGNLCIELSSPH